MEKDGLLVFDRKQAIVVEKVSISFIFAYVIETVILAQITSDNILMLTCDWSFPGGPEIYDCQILEIETRRDWRHRFCRNKWRRVFLWWKLSFNCFWKLIFRTGGPQVNKILRAPSSRLTRISYIATNVSILWVAILLLNLYSYERKRCSRNSV